MADSELSLIRFNIVNFFSLILNSRPFQPTSTILIKIVEALIYSESESDDKMKKRIKWIYENTHEKVLCSLSVVELAVFKNIDRGLNREIDIGNKTFYLFELYQYLDEISKELTQIVISIGKKYSVDLPFLNTTNQTKINLE